MIGKFLSLLAAFLVAGCVTNQQAYENPLLRALSGKDGNAGGEKEEITTEVDVADFMVASLAPGARPDRGTLEDGIWLQSDEAEQKLRTTGNRVHDEKLNEYISAIVCKLAGEYCSDMRTYVIRTPYFNATMSPNGMMQVWTGLLLRVRNEAQLAAILGHEVGHYLRRHGMQRIKDVTEKLNALIFVQLATAAAGIPAAGDIASLVAQGSISAFGRDHEREADGYGVVLLTQAGYDPREASAVWSNIIKEREAAGESSNYSLFAATHPPSEERRDALKVLGAQAIEKLVHGVAGDLGRDRFLEIILPLRAGFLRDELRVGDFKRTKVLLEALLEDGENPAEIHYFKGELYRLRQEKGDREKAVEAYEKALDEGNPPPDAYRALGLIHKKLGNMNRSATYLSRYVQLAPNAKDRLMIEHILKGEVK